MLHAGWLYYKDREKVMQKYDINIPEYPIIPDSDRIFVVFDDVSKKCERWSNITKFLLEKDDEENSL